MTTQHTPGPWRIVGGTEVRAGVGVICETAQYRAPTLSDQAAADARLIAAAPDMLTALQKLIGAIDRLPGNNPLDGLADEARETIRKINA